MGAKRDRSEPFPEDKELVSTFKKVAIEAKMNEWTVLKLGNVLHHLSHWLRQENRQPIFGRFNPDSPRHASFVADVKDYLKAGGRPAIVTQLNKVAPGSLPSREHLTGKLPAEDVNLLTRFRLDAEQRNIATKATVDGILSGFRQFALWLQHNNKGSLASQLQGGSLDKEISEYRAPGRDAQNRLTTTLANLQRFLPGPQQAKRLQSPAIGRPRKLAPHPEDAPLIEGALGQTLKDLGAPTAEQRVSAQMRATRLRGLSDWLRSEGKGSIADRLNGSKQEKLRLDVVAFQRTGKRIPSADLSHLRNYLKLIEANRDLRLQAREQSALPAVLDAGRPSPSQELPATAQSERAGTFLGEVMQECASPSTAKAPPGGYQVIPPHADLRDDAHFAPAHSAGVRSGTFGGLEPFVDLNAPTPSDLRDDAHFAPAHSARARSGTFGGLQSFVDLNAPTPSDLRDDAQSAPVRPRGGQMFGDVEPQPLMQGTGSAADLRPGGADDVQNIHRDRLSPQPALPVTAWLPDTYRGLPLVDVTMPTTSSSDALIGRVASSNVPAGSVLGATDWLSDAHIQRDYHLLEEQLLGIDPTLAARTRLVDPSVSNLLRQIERQDAEATLQSIYDQNDAPADFLFLPVNNGTPAHEGTHWSLLLVDRRNPQRHVAYHYDSLQRGQYNDAPATQLAGLLDATLVPARIAQQPNKFDCGVFVVDGTRALVERLVDGQRPDHAPLHLDNLVADRQALQNRLREERLPHEPAAIPAEAFLPAGSQVQHAVLQEQQA
ncbi:Ulp1 family isopeptidase, partial [Mesorhizobium sp. 98Argb]